MYSSKMAGYRREVKQLVLCSQNNLKLNALKTVETILQVSGIYHLPGPEEGHQHHFYPHPRPEECVAGCIRICSHGVCSVLVNHSLVFRSHQIGRVQIPFGNKHLKTSLGSPAHLLGLVHDVDVEVSQLCKFMTRTKRITTECFGLEV